MPNSIPSSKYAELAKIEVAALADSASAQWATQADIEEAYNGVNTDHYAHRAGMRDALSALATDIRS